jgi:primary-amine oxidase
MKPFRWFSWPLLAFAFGMVAADNASAQLCSGVNLVDVNFTAGTRWRFCWEMRQREGLVVFDAHYTHRNGTERQVLFRASVAQAHVPYHTGSPRFRDLTISTSGLGANALNLTAAECSPGTLLTSQVCRVIQDRGYAWKFGSAFLRGQEVTIWSSSQLGQYNYLTYWTFQDDGTIEPTLGFTGRLQITRTGDGYAPFGTRTNPESISPGTYGISHFHHIYYRFDFDIGGSANDAVDGLYPYQYYGPPGSGDTPCDQYGQCTANYTYRFFNESYDYLWGPFVSWRVLDTKITHAGGRNVGYEIEPINDAHWDAMTDTTEPWSLGDFFVTAYNGCELLATDNQPPYIPADCAGSATDVLQMTKDAQNTDGQDIVVWPVTTFHHLVREEDNPNMPVEYQGFRITPRSWRDRNTVSP